MIAIAFYFPGRSYHATPWGSHVNEGAVEWPPSPWRIIRALLAVGFNKLAWPDVAELPKQASPLIETLSQALPAYHLPPATPAHTRHYMPVIEGKNEKRVKIFDAFLRVIDDQPLLVAYDIQLESEQRELLADLLEKMTYLGRAESWITAKLLSPENTPTQGQITSPDWCLPSENSLSIPETQLVPLIAPISSSEYDEWRTRQLYETLSQKKLQRADEGKKLTPRDKAKLETDFPKDLPHALCTDTSVLQKSGWSQPPGSRRVWYRRGANALNPKPLSVVMSRIETQPVSAALLSLQSDTVRGNLLPLMGRAVPQAELLHKAILRHMAALDADCPVLRGTDSSGAPLAGHGHIRFFPLDLDEDGRIDHMLLTARSGFNAQAQTAIRHVRRTWSKGIDSDILVRCVGLGSLGLFFNNICTRIGTPPSILGSGHVWESVTPLILPRFTKKRTHTWEDQIRAELNSHHWPQPERVESLSRDELVQRGFFRFVRKRSDGKPQPPSTTPHGVRIVFSEVQNACSNGPLALGYASHWGLGLFAAVPGEGDD